MEPPKDSIRRFMSLEQEAEMRVMLRNAYKNGGMIALWQIIGEMSSSIQVVNIVIGEILEEEEKKQKDKG